MNRNIHDNIESIYNRNVDMVYRVCFTYMKNRTDTEDAVQEVFVKLIKSGKSFENIEHEKAWLIVTSANTCKDILKHWWKRKRVSYDENVIMEVNESTSRIDWILETVLNLPDKYKIIIYLYYYEGYDSNEISKILNRRPQTIRSLLSEGRKYIKDILKEDV